MNLQDDLESEDEVVAAAAAAAPAASAAPSRRRLKRQASITFDNVNDFIAWFIDDQGLKTIADYNKEILNSLERHSSKLSSCPSSPELVKILKNVLASTIHS